MTSSCVSARDVCATIGAALLGLRRPRRLRLDLVPTLDGIRVVPVSNPVTLVQLAPGMAPTPLLLAAPDADPIEVEIAIATTTACECGVETDVAELVAVGPHLVAPSYARKMADLRQQDSDLAHRSSREHAASLLCWLRSNPDTVGAVAYELVSGAYTDMLIDLGWSPRPWPQVSKELRVLAGARKRYVNRDGRKVNVFDIPDPAVDELAELYAADIAAAMPIREAA